MRLLCLAAALLVLLERGQSQQHDLTVAANEGVSAEQEREQAEDEEDEPARQFKATREWQEVQPAQEALMHHGGLTVLAGLFAMGSSSSAKLQLKAVTLIHDLLVEQCMTVFEGNLEEMDDNAALANEFELLFSNLTPTEWEMLLRTQNSGLALYEGTPDLPPTPRSPPQSDSLPYSPPPPQRRYGNTMRSLTNAA
ncbi:hypothetical protein HPB47_013063 [Ixodes persulcatus]|uniref:Uncharacterized protein n=1 Tax=Ixodes persulcatus TaxID=34615 RepID=A0AC60NRQ2_IXOPE|nr:hypothetical protein HPB47_013063 [Ixodes persulcatus]